jgi:hypothetical protein
MTSVADIVDIVNGEDTFANKEAKLTPQIKVINLICIIYYHNTYHYFIKG